MVSIGTVRSGRPREFDVDEALEAALTVFWSKGYEGSTLADLTAAMGITKTSMYAAFGNKEELFRKALDRYTNGPASYGYRALEEPTARRVVTTLLHGAATTTTRGGTPTGCLGVQAALVTGDAALPVREILVAWRRDVGAKLEERFRRALLEGDLQESSDPHALATYVMSVAYGIAVQAASGHSQSDLHDVADQAVRNGPWGSATAD
jgi:AcrR family transcriptional regulator